METSSAWAADKVVMKKTAATIGAIIATAFVIDKGGFVDTLTRDYVDTWPYMSNECEMTSETAIENAAAALELSAENIVDNGYDLDTFEDHGLTTLSPTVLEHTGNLDNPADAVDYLNAVTTVNYGFITTTEKPNDPQTLDDAIELVEVLSELPLELVENAAIQEVRLNADVPETHAANYNFLSQVISIGPGSPEAFGHELGHAFATAWTGENCEHAVPDLYPNFITINPAGFEYIEDYDGGNQLIENATIDSYGGTAVEEDFATIFDELTGTREDQQDCPYYTETETVKEKFAITIARMEESTPGAGDYYIKNLTERMCADPLAEPEG
jgi:hypothetical protein